jgi:hypothetical protein
MAQQINLYQVKFRKPRKPLSALEASLGLLLIIVSVLSYGGLTWQKNERLARESHDVDRQVESEKTKVDQLTAQINARKKDMQLEAAAQRAEHQVVSTRDVVQLVNSDTIGYTGGYSQQLRALARQDVDGLWLTGFTLSANAEEVQIRGRTVDPELVPAYLHRLTAESAMQGMRFDALAISTPAPPAAIKVAPGPEAAVAPPLKYLEFTMSAAQVGAAKPGGNP